jgi:hypothetical protein
LGQKNYGSVSVGGDTVLYTGLRIRDFGGYPPLKQMRPPPPLRTLDPRLAGLEIISHLVRGPRAPLIPTIRTDPRPGLPLD